MLASLRVGCKSYETGNHNHCHGKGGSRHPISSPHQHHPELSLVGFVKNQKRSRARKPSRRVRWPAAWAVRYDEEKCMTSKTYANSPVKSCKTCVHYRADSLGPVWGDCMRWQCMTMTAVRVATACGPQLRDWRQKPPSRSLRQWFYDKLWR